MLDVSKFLPRAKGASALIDRGQLHLDGLHADRGTRLTKLAHRSSGGVDVSLFRVEEDRDDKALVCVRDTREGEYFEIPTEGYLALDVFYHPFAYRDFSTVARDPAAAATGMDDYREHGPVARARVVLAERKTAGIRVRLVLAEDTNSVAVLVHDRGTGDQFEFSVEPWINALDAFLHPYAYAAWRGVDFGLADTRRAA